MCSPSVELTVAEPVADEVAELTKQLDKEALEDKEEDGEDGNDIHWRKLWPLIVEGVSDWLGSLPTTTLCPQMATMEMQAARRRRRKRRRKEVSYSDTLPSTAAQTELHESTHTHTHRPGAPWAPCLRATCIYSRVEH